MRFFAIITFILINTGILFSQIESEYMPVGAKWHYGHEVFGSLVAKSFFTVEVIADTIIDNRGAKVLWIGGANKPYCRDSVIIIRQVGNKIEYLQQDTFNLLYDFDAEVGDTFSINFPIQLSPHFIGPSTITYQVDSISMLSINEQMRRVQHLRFLTEEGHFTTYGPLIVEGIGSLYGWLLPYQECHTCGGEFYSISGLRCYEDGKLGYWQYSEEACDLNIIVSTKEVTPFSISIFPNPVRYALNLDFGEVFKGQVMLVSLTGRTFYNSSINRRNLTVNVETLPKGIYFLKFQGVKGYAARKVIIE